MSALRSGGGLIPDSAKPTIKRAIDKFLPVIFGENDAEFIPITLEDYTRYNVGTDAGYADLYRHITDPTHS